MSLRAEAKILRSLHLCLFVVAAGVIQPLPFNCHLQAHAVELAASDDARGHVFL
jgi:hypothetical protein